MKTRKYFAAEPDGTEFFGLQIKTCFQQMTFYKRVIKVYIVGYKNIFFEQFKNRFSNFFKPGSIGHHFIGNACHGLDKTGNGLAGIDKGFKFFSYFFSIKNKNSYFGNAVGCGITASGFY